MKHKTDKNHFDHQRHFAHFLWASNRGRQLYDMSIVQDDKKLGFQKKTEFENKSEFWKKTPWVLKTSEFFKKNPECWKNLSLQKKPWVLKKSEF